MIKLEGQVELILFPAVRPCSTYMETSANLFWEHRIILEMFIPLLSPPLSLSLLGFSSALTGPLALPRLDNVSRWLAVRAQWSDMETTRQALQELA